MMGITRGVSTLVGAAVAGFLIWLAVQIGQGSSAEYWTTYGLVAAAGLTMALSQIVGGWTKWGWPRLSLGVFLLGFLPVLVVGGWVLLARQPADFFNTMNWSRDLGIAGVVGDLGELLAAIAFGIGLTFGLTFDTAGPRREVVRDDVREHDDVRERDDDEREADDRPVTVTTHGRDAEVLHPVHDGTGDAADEPLTADRTTDRDDAHRTRPVATNPERRDEI